MFLVSEGAEVRSVSRLECIGSQPYVGVFVATCHSTWWTEYKHLIGNKQGKGSSGSYRNVITGNSGSAKR